LNQDLESEFRHRLIVWRSRFGGRYRVRCTQSAYCWNSWECFSRPHCIPLDYGRLISVGPPIVRAHGPWNRDASLELPTSYTMPLMFMWSIPVYYRLVTWVSKACAALFGTFLVLCSPPAYSPNLQTILLLTSDQWALRSWHRSIRCTLTYALRALPRPVIYACASIRWTCRCDEHPERPDQFSRYEHSRVATGYLGKAFLTR